MKCKDCKWCKWACPGYMCMNPDHPDFDDDSDVPILINVNNAGCDIFEKGESDYYKMQI